MLISHLATRECLATGKERKKGRTKSDQPRNWGRNQEMTMWLIGAGGEVAVPGGQVDISLLCIMCLFLY